MFNRKYLAGLEETFARFVSLLIVGVGFLVFIYGKQNELKLDSFGLLQIIFYFWFVYELLAYILYLFFSFFSNNQQIENDINKKMNVENWENTENTSEILEASEKVPLSKKTSKNKH